MSIHVALRHVTHYRYDKPINLAPQVVRLRPAPHCRTPILSYSLSIEPDTHFLNWQQDPFSNYLARLVFPEKAREFKITVDLVAEMAVFNPFDFFLEPTAETFPFTYDTALKQELQPYLVKGRRTKALSAFIKELDLTPRRTIDFLVDLNQKIHHAIRYLIRLEPGVQTPDKTLTQGSGSCRDSGWLMAQVLRHLGLATRFVSGYLIQLKPDVKSLDGPSGAEADFTDLHAWCEVYLPGAGWVGLDPTSGLFAGEGHIPLACSPDPRSAAPVTGAVDPCEVVFEHHMEVTRVLESPRVTLPYSDAQWAAIDRLGYAVDADLLTHDVRLTMGGEPTFVADHDRDAEEWNTAALGDSKRSYAIALIQKLRAEYGASGFLHFGQGKWYPGEQLPRWALSVYWRKDGEPCWHNPALFADEREPSTYTAEDAHRFTHRLTQTLGLDPLCILPAYEDAWYYLWRERKLPINVDPFDARLDDPQERDRLRRVFDQGLTQTVGYVLPIARQDHAWRTGRWFLRDGRLYLMPGDSPMGLRLPLDTLPWVAKADYPYIVPVDPFVSRHGLPAATVLRKQWQPPRALPAHPPAAVDRCCEDAPKPFESADKLIRTALCVEARAGRLYVFMPPLTDAEDYLALLSAVEYAAESLGVRLMLEGYPPPRDPRLTLLQVTPDPGVIEVNIHPASHWSELVERTEFLYQAAHETRLSTEKFMLDGRHTGTGGGNHFVLGGATPSDSPFLRRPDVLASLIAYWHNHPALSYLFSGMFIGPTSQAPRLDEARNDQVYEMEIALSELRQRLARQGQDTPPWLIDRVLRNLLIDVTGNTHRAEFCIDKLYSPDSSTGRLGLLELRAFEMPPHARMSLVQQLLIRALVARFWQQPYHAPMARWGTALHDRFMLPTFIQMDLEDVLTDLTEAGYPFDPSWFAPHFAFRFPRMGELDVRGIRLELHHALEPWHVMGEEGMVGGTARYVDSSLERVEVKVSGLNSSRYVVTVNGHAVPLQPTGRVGEYVAGVRYRAWQPYSALHPTIGVHAPLVFDVVDTEMGRSLGGCQYHVAHPGGLSHETFPVNAYEAESRRLARFTLMGHTPGRMTVKPAAPSLEHPFTLDLRRERS